MTKKAATEEKLGELHSKVADVMMNALENYDRFNEKERVVTDEDGNETPPLPLEPSAALIGAITKFLKDNDITCNTEESAKLSGLQARLASKERSGRKVVPLREMPVQEPEQGDAAPSEDALTALGLR